MEMKGRSMQYGKHMLTVLMSMALMLTFAFMPAIPQLGIGAEDAYADEGDVVAQGTKPITWMIIEGTDGNTLELGSSTDEILNSPIGESYNKDHSTEMYTSERDKWPWLSEENVANITKVDIVGDITAKGSLAYMFCNMPKVKTVDHLNRIDTKDVTDLTALFGNNEGTSPQLTEINGLQTWDTSKVKSTIHMFNGCTALRNVSFKSNLVSSATEEMHGMFYRCHSLQSVDVSGFDTSNIKYMNGIFRECRSLEKIDISNWDTSSNTYLGHMFNGCTSLESVTGIENIDTSKVTSTWQMFNNCKTLAGNLDLSKWKTDSLTSTSWMLHGTNLSSVDITGWDTSKVEGCWLMFANNPNLEEIKGLDGFDTSKVASCSGMFKDSPRLENLEMLDFVLGDETTANDMIAGCNAIVAKLNEMASSEQYSAETKAKLADAASKVQALTAAGTTTDEVKSALAIVKSELKDAAKEDAQRALDAANSPEVVEVANNASAATKKVYDDAKDALEKTLADSNSTANDINRAIDALNDAIANLEPKSDVEKKYDTAIREAEDAKKTADEALKKAKEEATKSPGSDAAVKAAEEATAKAAEAQKKAEDAQKAAADAVKAAEATGDEGKISAANELKTAADEAKAAADKAKADASSLEAEQKIKRAENNPTEENKKAAQDAANKALDAAKKAYGENSAEAQAAQQVVNTANNLPTTTLKVGDKFVVNSQKYEVLSLPSNGNCEAALAKGKNAKSVSVPKTVVYDGKTFDVTEINTKAFYKKTKKVTVGANVDTIDKQAFKGSKVAKVVLKTKDLTKKSVKGSLKSSKVKTVQVKVGGKKVNKKFVKKYKKIFTKKNAGKKVTVK